MRRADWLLGNHKRKEERMSVKGQDARTVNRLAKRLTFVVFLNLVSVGVVFAIPTAVVIIDYST